jgi:hypothetical protein
MISLTNPTLSSLFNKLTSHCIACRAYDTIQIYAGQKPADIHIMHLGVKKYIIHYFSAIISCNLKEGISGSEKYHL